MSNTNKQIYKGALGLIGELNDPMLCEDIADELSGIYDLERTMTRIIFGNANPKEYKTLAASIGRLPKIKGLLSGISAPLLAELRENIDLLEDIKNLIDISITEDPPITLKDGGVIAKGYKEELD